MARQARLERSGGSTPHLLRPQPRRLYPPPLLCKPCLVQARARLTVVFLTIRGLAQGGATPCLFRLCAPPPPTPKVPFRTSEGVCPGPPDRVVRGRVRGTSDA